MWPGSTHRSGLRRRLRPDGNLVIVRTFMSLWFANHGTFE